MERPSARSPLDEPTASGGGHGGERPPGPRRVANVYLRHPASAGNGRRLGLLARTLGLELYSAALLTRKNRAELTVLAVMLAGVFGFELLAWSFFFNGIFVGEMFRLHPAGTTAAVVLGLLFAATILYFERQVVTADATRLPRRKKVIAAILRLGAILVAGFVVAHSVDLIAFRVPVQLVLHREAVVAKANLLAADLATLGAQDDRPAEWRADIRRLGESLDDLRSRRDNVAAIAEELRKGKESLDRAAAGAHDAWFRIEDRAAQGDATDPQIESARRRAERASDAARSAGAQYSSQLRSLEGLDGQLQAIQRQQQEVAGQLQRHNDEHAAKAKVLEQLEQRARHWLSTVAQERPTSEADYADYVEDLSRVPEAERRNWPREWQEPFRLDPPNASFFEKLEVIYDLISDRAEAAPAPPASSLLPAEALEARQPRRRLYWFTFWGIHVAVMLVPSLVLAVKWLLLPKEVDAYFSTWHQAHAGDAEARLMLSVEETVRGERELW